MGLLNSYWEALLQLATTANLLDGYHSSYPQQPLNIPKHTAGLSDVSAAGVSFQVPGTGFTCSYPSMTRHQACNSAKDRSCWLKPLNRKDTRYDIHTQYDMPGDEFSPPGITREYWLEVSVDPIAPDGYLKPLGQVFNHTYPGPHLQACWGDQIVVHVTNKIVHLGTTIHWHGIRQLNTTEHDGVNGVTQCPIAFGDTYTYNFTADQYGHTWYHSHYQTQYSDGVAGPLTIYGPSSSNWDETFTPIMMQDWVHENTSIAFQQDLAGAIPIGDSLLLGGTSSYKCSALDPYCCSSCNSTRTACKAGMDPAFCCDPDDRCFKSVTNADGSVSTVRQSGGIYAKTFEAGKRYLFQLINASADAMFIFAIDDHELEVIEADLVPIKPYKTDSVFIAIGQRYQVIVHAKPLGNQDSPSKDYWIRTRIANGCGNVAQDNEETGIIRYNASSRATPSTEAHTDREVCADEPMASLSPIVPWNASDLRNSRDEYTFVASLDTKATHGAYRWEIKDDPLFLNYSSPSILNVNNPAHFEDVFQATVNYTNNAWNGGFVYLVIDGSNIQKIPGKQGVPAAHPIHLHGHDFVILAQVDSAFNGTIPPNRVQNPTRRDTALLYGGGYLALAFKLDNPGIWLVHCHIAWHASSGLALQIVERQDEILSSIGPLDATQKTCDGWHQMGLQFHQEDSGI
ncbi:Laccase-2 [Fulvia fulva]|nr:Laccase-2 [Fulvia fulva]KAK4616689.1 Laccase-2 [Fulvia fulva]WPV33810.1 Laccase-2 [Fulvia fulva]